MATDSAPPTASPLFKALASSSTTRRRQAMSSLRTYLTSSRTFTYTDFLKLWKALFYCLYMTPKMRNQQRLSIDISELVLLFDAGDEDGDEAEMEGKGAKTGLFVKAFWEMMRREWPGIDKARMDKFLFLVRRMVYTTLLACRVDAVADGDEDGEQDGEDGERDEEAEEKYEWDESMLKEVMHAMREVPFHPRDPKVSVGLQLHVIDVYVDELDKVDPRRSIPTDLVLAPLKTLQKDSLTKSVRSRAKEALGDERLQEWVGGVNHRAAKYASDEASGNVDGVDVDIDGDEEEEWGGFGD